MQTLYLYIIGIVTIVALSAGAFRTIKSLSKLRDPLLVWDTLRNMEYMPLRMQAWLFSIFIGMANPYSRSINFRFTQLSKGRACGVMKETKQITNPFRSVHAGALVTFGETIGGTALFTLLGKKDRAILTNIQCEYIKKAKGYLTATSVVPEFTDSHMSSIATEVIIKDASFDTVAKLTLTWKTDLKDE
ncbi:hypothetical protein BGX28_004104 [Mortierella sp. GBA30]|nr:hypothetical protein BGX28_004104 [Mortierella sp. GBA30]